MDKRCRFWAGVTVTTFTLGRELGAAEDEVMDFRS